MKKIITNATLLTVVCLLFTAAGYSQQMVIKADVPFEFSVGNKTFPAGEYWVVKVAPSTLSLRSSNSDPLLTVITAPMQSFKDLRKAKLTFKHVDGQYILSQVWPVGANGYELLIPQRSRRIAEKQPAGTEVSAVVPTADRK